MGEQTLLSVSGLTTRFYTDSGTVAAVNDVSFELQAGERLAIVGESGSGKSAMAMSLIRLIAYPGRVTAGNVRFDGVDLLRLSEAELNGLRGSKIGTVFQDPMTSLDPVMRVGEQMVPPLRKHLRLSAAAAEERAARLLEQVGIPEPASRLRSYPFELSGGMRQRVMIAMALSCKPKLILADEPTTALDVTIQAQIVELLKSLTETMGTAMLFITHDLGLVARFAQKVAVMYAGRIVEFGTVEQIFESPQHPYTQSLLRTIPSIAGSKARRLLQIGGFPPDMRKLISGCAFKDRCPAADAQCFHEQPPLEERASGHSAACWREAGLSGWESASSVQVTVGAGEEEGGQVVRGGAVAAVSAVAADLVETSDGRLAALDPGVGSRDGIGEAADTVSGPSSFMDGGSEIVLRVNGLRKEFRKSSAIPWRKSVAIRAVNGVSLELKRGETLGLVGESGCGKSTTARLLLSLDEASGGSIEVLGSDLAGLDKEKMRFYRNRIQMVFQDPYSSFNPRMRIEDIIAEPLDVQGIGTRAERRKRGRELAAQVGLDASHLSRYPGELSGGQRQRVGIARALALNPSVIVADEPTSALDVSVRAQVINLLCDLKEEMGLSFVFISHDLSTVRHISDRIAVMYLGEIVEEGPAEEVFDRPLHPYTRALLAAVPVPNPRVEAQRSVTALQGELPSPANPPLGCAFSSRCPLADEHCRSVKPALVAYGARKAACHAVG